MQFLKKISLFLLLLLILTVAGLMAAPFFVDPAKYKKDFADKIKEISGEEVQIEGQVSISFLPRPEIRFDNVFIKNIKGASTENIFSAQSVLVESTLHSLAMSSVDIKQLTLINAIFEFEKLQDGTKNWHKVLRHVNNNISDRNYNLPLFIALEKSVIVYRNYKDEVVLDDVNIDLDISANNQSYNLDGSFFYNYNKINASLTIAGLTTGSDVGMNLTSDSFSVVFAGNIQKEKEVFVQGEIKGDIKNFKQFINSFASSTSVLNHITSEERINYSGDLIFSSNLFNIKNFVVDSNNIQGNGDIKIALDHSFVWDINFKIKTIDIDELTKTHEKDYINPLTPISSITLKDFSFDIPDTLSFLFYLSIDKIVYRGDIIKNIRVDADLFNQEVVIHNFIAYLPGDSRLKFSGALSHNDIRPLLQGNINLKGNKLRSMVNWILPGTTFIPVSELGSYMASAFLELTPRKAVFSNFHLSFDKSDVNGDFEIRSANPVSTLNVNLKVDSFNADRYLIDKELFKIAKEFITTTNDRFIENSWIKTFGLKMSLALTIEDLFFNSNQGRNFLLNIGISPNYFAIQRFFVEFANGQENINLKYAVNFSTPKPQIDSNIRSTKLDLEKFLPPKNVNNNEDKVAIGKGSPDSIWPDKEFNFLDLEKYSGKLKTEISNLIYKRLELKNLDIEAELKEKIIDFKKFKAAFSTGEFEVKGKFSVSSAAPSIGVSVAISDVEIFDILKIATNDINAMGRLFLSGTVKTIGKTPREWINQMTSGSNVSIMGLRIKGFDLQHLINNVPRLKSAIDLDSLAKQISTSGITVINKATGTAQIVDGTVQLHNFQFSAEKVIGAFAGNYNLHNLTLNSLTKFAFLPEYGKRLVFSLGLTGDILAPTKKLDLAEIEGYITEKAR